MTKNFCVKGISDVMSYAD